MMKMIRRMKNINISKYWNPSECVTMIDEELFVEPTHTEMKELYVTAKLKMDNVDKLVESVPLVSPASVFVNSELRMKDIQVCGFDFDYTLADYTEALLEWIYSEAAQCLVEQFSYPAELLSFRFDMAFAIRGLHYDLEKGYLLKIDNVHRIHEAYFGRRKLSEEECGGMYSFNAQTKNND